MQGMFKPVVSTVARSLRQQLPLMAGLINIAAFLAPLCMSARALAASSATPKGKIVSVVGAVVDVQFDGGMCSTRSLHGLY